MRRIKLFLSRFAIGLWAILVSTFVFLLTSNAPSVPTNAPFASLGIREVGSLVYLPNRIFDCKGENRQFQCQAEIQDQLLQLTLSHKGQSENSDYMFSSCDASYDGKPIACKNSGSTYAPIISQSYEITGLGLNAQQMRSIQQEYWSMNALMQLGEIRLFWITTGLSIAAGLTAAFFAWLHPNSLTKSFVSFICGFGMYQLIGGWLGRIPFDMLTSYGVSSDSWMVLIIVISIATGIVTTIATATLLWRRSNRLITVSLGLISSVGVYSLCLQSLGWNMSSFFSLLFLVMGIDLSSQPEILQILLIVVSTVPTIAAAILLWSRTSRSTKAFMTLGSGFGAVALTTNFFLLLLLGLGYAD